MSQPPGNGSNEPGSYNPNTGLPYSSGAGDQNPYGQDPYNQNPYGQGSAPAPYGQSGGEYGSPQTAAYGQPAPYGQPSPYGQDPYGQPVYGAEAPAGPGYGTGGPFGGPPTGESDKSFVATWLLGWLLGGFGADRFYLGKMGTAIAKLAITVVSLGTLGWIWALIDVLRTLFGATRDTADRPLAGYEQNKKMARLVFFIVWGLGVIVSIIMAIVMAVTGVFTAATYSGTSGGTSGGSSSSAPQDPAPGSDEEPGGAEPASGDAAAWADQTFGTFETVEESGSGDGEVTFPADVQGAIITFEVTPDDEWGSATLESVGADNQTTSDVYLYSSMGAEGETSGMWIAGDYSDPVSGLRVSGEADWTVTVTPVGAADALPESGSGPGVYLYDGPGGMQDISTTSESGMFATQYGPTEYADVSPTVVVSEATASWSGSGDMEPGPGIVDIDTDGDWTITPQ